jgi:hypothetical protein
MSTPISTPRFSSVAIVGDDPYLTAILCSRLAKQGEYLTVLEAPRMRRRDVQAEVVICSNTLARVGATRNFFAGVQVDAKIALRSYSNGGDIIDVSSEDEIAAIPALHSNGELVWGRNNVGVGLLKAMREKKHLVFSDTAPTQKFQSGLNSHLVVVEDGDPLAQVIAANYAWSLGAGICIIAEVSKVKEGDILARFYSSSDASHTVSQQQVLGDIAETLRLLVGDAPIPKAGSSASVTFITGKLPYGFAFPEIPSTHLFAYPRLGVTIVNGFAQQTDRPKGTVVAAVVDPKRTDAPEVAKVRTALLNRGSLVRTYEGDGASVRAISAMIDWYPYDFLLIATHCGDVSGVRDTYRFTDRAGRERELVVDSAPGIASTDDPDLFKVTVMNVFHSIDGVSWTDPDKDSKVEVGTAIEDWIDLTTGERELKPVKKEPTDRVHGSAALAMSDFNYIAMMMQTIAGYGNPIIVNNACVSWHQLASRFMYAGASTYIGTLVEVLPWEAEEVIVRAITKHYDKPLPQAIWSAQRETYQGSVRKPYVVTGVYTSKLRPATADAPEYIARRILGMMDILSNRRKGQFNDYAVKELGEALTYYQREFEHLVKAYPKHKPMFDSLLQTFLARRQTR